MNRAILMAAVVAMGMSCAAGAWAAEEAAAPATAPAAPATQPVKEWTTNLGVKIAVERAGEAAAQDGDILVVHYTGWLQSDGSKFDSSFDHPGAKPFQFQLGAQGVIRGWEDGCRGMTVGEKRKLTIPPSQGYGFTGKGAVPANATLIFDIECLGIVRLGPVQQ